MSRPGSGQAHLPVEGDRQDRFRGCLTGLAAGDAVGTTVEFLRRGSFPPVTDMMGGGPFRLQPGQWTDDTSMALCLAHSLLETGGFDPQDQMERYCRWHGAGYMSSTGKCFDIGNTVRGALRRFQETGEPFSGSESPTAAGNGSIMRLAPIPMFYHRDIDTAVRFSVESSRTTHGTVECLDACRLLSAMLVLALQGADRDAILLSHRGSAQFCPGIQAIADGAYLEKEESQVRGLGYVVASLEAALWCFARSDDFRSAILLAANLGDDADTTAAICGQLAGAVYGLGGIPAGWREKLTMKDDLIVLADQLMHHEADAPC